jgi:hypothetical protein
MGTGRASFPGLKLCLIPERMDRPAWAKRQKPGERRSRPRLYGKPYGEKVEAVGRRKESRRRIRVMPTTPEITLDVNDKHTARMARNRALTGRRKRQAWAGPAKPAMTGKGRILGLSGADPDKTRAIHRHIPAGMDTGRLGNGGGSDGGDRGKVMMSGFASLTPSLRTRREPLYETSHGGLGAKDRAREG